MLLFYFMVFLTSHLINDTDSLSSHVLYTGCVYWLFKYIYIDRHCVYLANLPLYNLIAETKEIIVYFMYKDLNLKFLF